MTDEPMTGAQLLVRSLTELGVTTVYGVPGEETTELMTAIHKSALEFILCHHEQGAAFMASVHGRLTGKPAVCLATLGPGATNLVTGVADAQLDHVPLIAITGQGARGRLGRESHQVIDLERLFEPVTKFSRRILQASDIPASVAEAWRQSQSEKPGAVHLSLPEDVAIATATAAFVPVALPEHGPPSAAILDAAAARIKHADRPVIVVGAGAHRAGAVDALREFAEGTQIPLATTFMAKGVLPMDHPQTLFTVGQPDDDHVDQALEVADLIISIGVDPVEYPTLFITQDGAVPVVNIDAFAAPVDSGWSVEVQVTGNIRDALDGLRTRLDGAVWAGDAAFDAARDAMIQSLTTGRGGAPKGKIAPADICAEITRQLRDEDTVLSGVGLHKLWVARNVQATRPGQVIVPNGLAGMGLALPGAIAAARLKDKGRVLAVCGDGDMLMNMQEMETAARLGLRLTVMVWEDGGYGLIDAYQSDDGPEFGFRPPNWADLAHAFGWLHAAATDVEDLPAVLTAAHDAEGPTLITVPVDYAAGGGLPSHGDAA